MEEIISGFLVFLMLAINIALAILSYRNSSEGSAYAKFRSNRMDLGKKIVASFRYKKWLKEAKTPTIQALLLKSGQDIKSKSAVQWHVLNKRDIHPELY